jgi:ketosteroid isomerase-like protein
MAPRNADVFRETVAAFDRRDRDAWLANCDPDHEVIPSETFPEAHPVRGREAAWQYYVDVTAAFEAVQFAREVEIDEAGPDKLLVHQHNVVRGRASGADVVLDYWIVITFRDGKLRRDEWFEDRDAAKAAAGAEG